MWRRQFAVSKVKIQSKLDRMDMDDFRLRVLSKLKKPLVVQNDIHRTASLARSGMLEWQNFVGLEPSLSQVTNIVDIFMICV
jgi:hypothetical protein